MESNIKENTKKIKRATTSSEREGLFPRLIEACGGKYYTFFLVALFTSGSIAGALLAHMSVKAEATTSPYLFSGNIIRMPINTSRVTGEQSAVAPTLNEVPSNPTSYFTTTTIHQKIQYTVMDSQSTPAPKEQKTLSRGLVSFGNGVVSILTDDGIAPVKLTPSSSSILPSFVLDHGDNSSSSLLSNAQKKKSDGDNKLFLASASSLLFSHCAIRPETKRGGLQSFIDKMELQANLTKATMSPLQYRSVVEHYASKYRLAPELILGIIRTESNFNPYAVSQSKALGLMQIVPSTAGEEVYGYLTGENGKPSPELLFQPEKNIQYGTIYLHLLNTRYFQDISNTVSRRLLMIAAYNGGPNAVLRVFSPSNGEAIAIVNSMTPDLVYKELTEKMPRLESRLYVDRVLNSIQSFINS